jgi:soluble lytic murein transglycosylase-like protein
MAAALAAAANGGDRLLTAEARTAMESRVDSASLHEAAIAEHCPTLRGDKGAADRSAIVAAAGEASEKYGVDEELIYAVIVNESRCRIDARSNRGAVGLMQLMPRTAEYLGVRDPLIVHENIDGGAKYLARLLRSFDGDVDLALAAYNVGPARLRREKVGAPKYVERVKTTYQKMRDLRLVRTDDAGMALS